VRRALPVEALFAPDHEQGDDMQRVGTFLGSTVGKKVVMGATGLVLFGFVFAHMVGNLQIFMGSEALNAYSEFLHEFLHGMGLWIARGSLLVAVALHVWASTSLTLANAAARPVGYRETQRRESTYASRTMVWSGPILALFIVYHLLHLTTGTVHASFVPGDVYHNVVAGFRAWPVSAAYIAAMVALGFHLWHGVWSMLQSLGLSHPRWNALRRTCATVFTAVVIGVNISFPIAVLVGIVSE
jgi:succinate dehydrogenase / fumarate reductase cytochrome b subunit